MLMVIVAFVVRMRATGTGWIAILPDRVLVWSIPLDSRPGTGPVSIELKRRLLTESLSQGATSALMDRLLNGDNSSPPGSDAWIRRYGHLANHWAMLINDKDDPLVPQMLQVIPKISVEVPGAWPDSKPVPALLSVNDWWPYGTEGHVSIRWPDTEQTELATIAFRNYSSGGRPFPFTLPPRNQWPTGTTVDLDVEIKTRRPAEDWEDQPLDSVAWEDFSKSRKSSTTVIAPTDVEIELTPLDTPQLEEIAQRIFRPGLRRFSSTQRPYAIRFDPRVLQEDAPQGIAFGFNVEIIERFADGTEKVRRRSRIWINNRPNQAIRSGWMLSEEDIEGLARAFDSNNTSTWLMEVTGDRDLALRAVAASGGDPGAFEHYWTGSTRFELPIHHERGAGFTRHWFIEGGPEMPR